MPFQKGQGGRPKGAKNLRQPEVAGWARKLVEDRDYRQKFKARLLAGELSPAVETMLWYYAYGKPVETHEVGGPDGAPLGPMTYIVRLREDT